MLSSKQLTLVQSVPKENRPCHIGVIMDGNGRWAEKKKLPQGQGHRAGGQAIEKIIDACLLFEIPVLTLYAFSTENWNRPQSEVTNLMQILREYIEKHASKVIEKDIRFRTLGDISVLDADIYKNLSIIEKKSKNKKKMTLCLAINYGGRDEIVRATKKILQDFKLGKIDTDKITESKLSCYLDTRSLPEVDLIIRTGDRYRISNFLLWQSAYAEFYFTKTLWPNFDFKEFHNALLDFSQRKRTKGKREI